MSKTSEKRHYHEVNGIERVEYPCKCGQGFYRYDPDGERSTHNQLPHRCTKCNELVFFSILYPALRYKGRIFVDWETVRKPRD